ncbi:hypothetical protein [Mucilaginibacter aquatilis]|uniref:Uncharacterized protein n=1 Tax=Mucilaginibacter aquatilis TaxID=1517760 RepID=A0A6I4I6L4_9SPHI|nr:hypothetical protein [Mucilaginibacter aquatilis]MVN90790.1 hypothetical protein [Mucilaginibacter aquatilis]
MQSTFIQYRKFDDPALAENLIALLIANSVTYQSEENKLSFDPSFGAVSETSTEYVVKIAPVDFELVNQLVMAHEEATLDQIEEDHYLHKFTDEELTDILIKPDEWSFTDVILAGRLLKERGAPADAETIKTLKQKHLAELRMPAPSQTNWIIVGYLLAPLGGIISVFIGWHLMSHKNILPNGEYVFRYVERDRQHGRIIFIVGIMFILIITAFRIWREQ